MKKIVFPPEENSFSLLLLPLNSVIWRKGAECENFTFRTFKIRYVSILSVQKHLKNLQRAKACGLDQLPSNLLKDAANKIARSLTYIIIFCLLLQLYREIGKRLKFLLYTSLDQQLNSRTTVPFQFCLLYPKLWSVKYTGSCMNSLTKLNLYPNINLAFKRSNRLS